MENSPFVPQENGTYLPSADLVRRVRENPDKFPNAVDDFTALSGLPREEVESILGNQSRPGGIFDTGLLGAGNRLTGAAIEGLGDAAGFAADKLFGAGGDTIRDATDFDPAFETEESTGEKVGEVVGQAAPAVAGAVATGGALPAAVVGAGIAHLSFGDEDNLLTLGNDYIDGAIPDFLVVNPEDDADTSAVKSIASNLIVDLAAAGITAPIAKLYRVFKETPDGFVDMAALKEMSDETGIPLRETPGSADTAQKAVLDVARKAADEEPSVLDDARVRKGSARDKVIADIATKELGHPIIKGADEVVEVPEDVVQAFQKEVMGPVARLLNRSKETNVGRKAGIESFEEKGYKAYTAHSEEVLKALTANNVPDVLRLVREIDKMPQATTVGHDYKTAILNASLKRVDDNFEAIIHRIREEPNLTTKRAWKELAAEYHANKVQLAEMYREIGSSSAYAFLTRKGVKFDDAILRPIREAEVELSKQLKEEGFNLFSSRAEFVAAKALSLDEMGFDTLAVLDDLYKMFDEFDAARAGVIDNLSNSRMVKLTKAERERLEGSFMRMMQDLHSSALLGQPSTAGLELMSNTLNNALLPFTQHALRGNVKRAWREYAGYSTAVRRGWDTFWSAYRRGKSVTDDFDVLDAAHASKIDYDKLAKEGKMVRYMLVRLWKFAADWSIASSEAQKAFRGMGVAYADGYELALKQGATKPQAKKMALEYANGMFDENGAFTDTALKIDVQQTSWQSVFDTRYATGRVAQFVDNWRNHPSPYISVMARAAVPFWRTLINISSHSLQTVQPFPSVLLKAFAKTPYAGKFVKTAKFLDDFTGANGAHAQQRAIGRQRLGYATMAAAWAAVEAGKIDITGPSGYKRWDAKLAEFQEYPPSSIIVNGHAVDLTRLLPFSAPLMLVGVMKDMERENALQMKGGNYVSEEDSAYNMGATYGTALGYLTLTLMSDAASFRGLGDLWGAAESAMKEGDVRGLVRYAQDYAQQYTPGLVRAAGKNQGFATGDWTQHEAEGFLNKVLASAGWHTGYTRLDFLGHPVEDPARGLDPLNMKPVKASSDPLRAEYVMLNKSAELGLLLDKPDGVFDKTFWKNLGVVPSTADWLFGTEAPSLTEMKTKDGANAWERYRELVYKGTASEDISKSTGRYGDRINVGSVTVKKGENFETALRRIIETPGYQGLTPDARAKVFKTVFGVFKKNAKDHLKDNLVVDPQLFEESRYGSPIASPATLGETQDAGKDLAADIQRTRGSPLDDIFSID